MKKRVRYLINKRMQLGWTLKFLFTALIFALFIGFSVYITVWPVVSGTIPKGLMDLVKSQILFRMLFFAIPAIFVIIAYAIVMTHRIAGPLYRLEVTLDKLVKGEDADLITLRKNDELQEIAGKTNDLILLLKASKTPKKEVSPPPP